MDDYTESIGTKNRSNIRADSKFQNQLISNATYVPKKEDTFMQDFRDHAKYGGKSDSLQPQVLNIPNHAHRWLKQPVSDDEDDPLSALVRSKQQSDSLRWASPVNDGPSVGSIQASSQLLEEHVVLLNLEDSEASKISVVTPEVWPHHSESDTAKPSVNDSNAQRKGPMVTFESDNTHKTSAPYKPEDAIQRLSPIFDEPSDIENASLNDSSPEQVVPVESHVLKGNRSDHQNMYGSGFTYNRPKDFGSRDIHGQDVWCSTSQSVPNLKVLTDGEKLSYESPDTKTICLKEKNPTGARSESYYDLCFLTSDSDMETDNPNNIDSIGNVSNIDSDVGDILHIHSQAGCLVPDSHHFDTGEDQKQSYQARSSLLTNQSMLNSFSGAKDCVSQLPSTEGSVSRLISTDGGICRLPSTCSTTESELSSEVTNIPLIEQLPEELIFKILFYLSIQDLSLSVAPVSHKWRSFAYDPILWQFIDLSQYHHLDSLHVCRLLRRAKLLKSLNLRGRHGLNLMEVKLLGYHCTMLQEINLGFCESLKDNIVQTIAYHCKALTTVNVEGCEMVGNTVAYHFTCLPELRVLNLSHCTKITDEAIINIAVLCEKLEALNIDGIPWISDT